MISKGMIQNGSMKCLAGAMCPNSLITGYCRFPIFRKRCNDKYIGGRSMGVSKQNAFGMAHCVGVSVPMD